MPPGLQSQAPVARARLELADMLWVLKGPFELLVYLTGT